jgi:hypothetical protein
VVTGHVDGATTVQRSHSHVSGYPSFGPVYGHTHLYPYYRYYSPYRYVPYYGYYGSYGYGSAVPYYYSGSYRNYYDQAPTSQYPAQLRIVDAPPSAEVYVDGDYAGIVDDFDGVSEHLELTPGPHRIEIRAPGFEPTTFDVNAIDGQTIIYRARMIPF